MADASIDVLMKVVGPTGPYEAESSTEFKTKPVMDLLRSGFTPGQFCELQTFSFSAGVTSSLSKKETEDQKGASALEQEAMKRAAQERRPVQEVRDEMLTRLHRTSRAKSSKDESVDIQPVEFTRIMDSMSTLLFKAMVGCDTLESISVVKRKATGSANSGDCFLRLDFTKVLLTHLDWKDTGPHMVESGKFIYRKLTMRYRPQRPNGSLDVAVQTEWEMKAAGAK